MRFYDRTNELANLSKTFERSRTNAQMTLLIGRRRVGKTTLLKEAYPSALYFFVSKKSEPLLIQEYVETIQSRLGVKIFGEFKTFSKLFEYLLDLSTQQPLTLIIDEFQEFYEINPSIYSEIQNLWDSYKDQSRINLIFCGSIYSLMTRIFEHAKEPLFGRVTNRINLKPFDVKTLEEILKDHRPGYTKEDFLSFYMLTGGVAKYIELFVDRGALTLESMLENIFEENSLFLDEGKNILIEEFGKEYATYFTILSLIASSKTSRREIESILEKNVGGYLDRLEKEYSIIKKIRPIFAKEGSRTVKYEIIDNFLNFWFRFIYKYRSAVEIENFDYLKETVLRDYPTFSGKFLERLFTEKLKATKEYSAIGTYWERGNQNEIDIVAINEKEKTVLFAEVKRDPRRIDMNLLKKKSEKLLQKLKGYTASYRGFSLEDL